MKTGTLNAVLALVAICIVLTVINAAVQYLTQDYTTETALLSVGSDSELVQGVFIRDEKVISYSGKGVISYEVSDGGKLGIGSPIATVYSTETQIGIKQRIAALQKEYAVLERISNPGTTKTAQPSNLSALFTERYKDFLYHREQGDLAALPEQSEELVVLLSTYQLVTGQDAGYTQKMLEVKAESQRQVRMDAPFVEFIENDGVNTRQFRIVLNQARENAFGQHLYSGFRRDFGIEACAVTDKSSERGVHQRGDAFRRCARGETARLKHENFSRIRSGFFIKKRRNEGCFSRSGRGAENRRSVRMQGFRELRKDRFYGKLDQRLTIFSGLTILSNSSAERKPSSTHASLRVCPL